MPSKLVFTPLEASNATDAYVEGLRTNTHEGMPLYIKSLDYSSKDHKGFLPVKRGELITVLGRPGCGKTGFMLRWARMRAADLMNRNVTNSVVVYVTMEQLIEELRLFQVAAEEKISASDMADARLAGEQWDAVGKRVKQLQTVPLWFIGKSMRRRKDKLQITEQTLRDALASIEAWQGDDITTEIDSVFVDYLQRFRSTGSEWVQFYGDLVNGLKDMAGDFASHFIVGVQARRDVDDRAVQIPQPDDGQWTSAIEQQSDGMLAVTRPARYVEIGGMFDDVPVPDHNQMIVSVLKRKLGPDNFKKWVTFRPEYNALDEAELRLFNPNEGA
jgi:replicative DNA helicase